MKIRIQLILVSCYLWACNSTASEMEITELKAELHNQFMIIRSLQNVVQDLRTKGEENEKVYRTLLESNIDEHRKSEAKYRKLFKKFDDFIKSDEYCLCTRKKGKYVSGDKEDSQNNVEMEAKDKGRYINRLLNENGMNFPGSDVKLASSTSFFAHLTKVMSVQLYSVLVFDQVLTDSGNHYNQTSGIFTVPVDGTYVFLWKILVLSGALRTELVINEMAQAAIYNDASDKNMVSATGFAVLQVKTGDSIFIRVGQFDNTTAMSFTSYDYSSFGGYILP